ncbi:MAG: LysR family transcriptional regulator [Thiotrichales bacterium SG8_50]|jgi:DNA-binding transcriptional LysR family regulator|nr:MAG: LysR family transcriptional regulator [Thiotrichales bacterium SG8_50]
MPSSNDHSYTPPAAMPDYLIRHATLRQLQVFEAIVRLGSFTRAAEELFLTQPTVSMQIRKLTDAMGLPLFQHVGRNVEPTEAGLELYEACRRLFETLANLEMKVADLKGMKRGRLRMGVITTAKYLAPEILGEFSQLYPGIDLALKVTNRESIIERMHANEDDLYIMGQAPEDELDVEAFPFAPNPLVVMAPRNHPLVGKKNITLEEIAKQPFIIREPGSGIRDATLRTFEAKGLRPQIRMELGSNEAIKHAIVGGLGLSVLSLHTLTLEGTDGPVAILDVEGFPILRNWYIVYPKGKELSLVARTFLEFAIENEPKIRERMQTMWPALKHLLNGNNKSAKRKKKSAKK